MSRLTHSLAAIFDRRWRGFRTVNVWAAVVVVVLALGVYAFKADAGREAGRIKEVDQQIAEETKAVTLLRAEVAHLEQPERLERLSVHYLGLQPRDARRESTADSLIDLAHRSEPAPKPGASAPAAAPAAAPAQEPAR